MTEGNRNVLQSSIKVNPESELAATIKQAHETGETITVDTGDAVYRVCVAGRAEIPRSDDDVARSRASLRKAIGTWKTIDVEAFKAYIIGRRRPENRPSVRW
ncbi:MAG: hypothetical protein ACRDFX_12830 [Chloroflexota bacterium]